MNIIKNLILRNNLRDKLNEIERTLEINGYYEKEKELRNFRFQPDEYAQLYEQIEQQYGDNLKRRSSINKQIRQFSTQKYHKF